MNKATAPEKKIYLAVLLVFTCLLVYSNSLSGPFISDDISAVLRNPKLLNPLSYWDSPNMLLNSLDYLLGRHNPFVYHLTNILLHALNTLLVFLVLRLFFNPGASFMGALIFSVHPIHTEAVSWVSGRPYLLMASFMLSNLLLYNSLFSGKKDFKAIRYLACLLIFFYTIIPENSYHYYLFPGLVLLLDISLRRWRANWRLWLPFFALAGLKLFLTKGAVVERAYILARGGGFQEPVWNNPFLTLAHSLSSNFALLLWPARLTLYHEPIISSPLLLALEVLFMFIFLLGLAYAFKKNRALFFAGAVFLLFLLHTFSPFPVSWMIAERYLYLPSLSLSVFFALCYKRCAAQGRVLKISALAAVLLIVLFFSLRTILRNEDWADPGRFWRQELKTSPGSVNVHIKMGDVYAREGDLDAAFSELEGAIALKPRDPVVLNNLGNAYAQMGELQKASSAYLKAAESDPEFAEAYFNLGNVSFASGRKEEAASYYRKAIGIKPGVPEFYLNLGFAYEALGKEEQAVEAYKKALEIYPHFAIAHNNLSAVYYRQKKYDLAVNHCDLALKCGYKVNPGLRELLQPYRKQ